jgi:hypothetical protein
VEDGAAHEIAVTGRRFDPPAKRRRAPSRAKRPGRPAGIRNHAEIVPWLRCRRNGSPKALRRNRKRSDGISP